MLWGAIFVTAVLAAILWAVFGFLVMWLFWSRDSLEDPRVGEVALEDPSA